MQLDHNTSTFTPRKFPITIICQDVTNAPNLGSLFRTADAFGVEKLIFCGAHIPLGRKMTKTSRATEKYVNYEISEDALDAISKLKTKDHFLVALEITTNSQPVLNFKFPKDKPIILVIGDENFGVSQAVLDICDAVIHINMYGNNSSMNVVQATSITLYEITKQIT